MKNFLTRRDAMRFGAAAIAVPAMLSLEGCTITKAQLEAYAADIDSGAAAIATALGDAPLAATITADLAVFNKAVEAWTGGSVVQDIISASQILEIALGATGLPAPLIAAADVLINVLDTILSNWPKQTATPPATGALNAHTVGGVVAVRPRVARIYKNRKEAVADWNAKASVGPLANVVLK